MVALVLALLAMPAAALAQASDPTGAEYNDRVQQVQAGGGGGGPEDSGLGGRVVDPLPFTGFDVIAMAAVALAVTGLGLALQRAVSRERQGLE
jgi:opacity protein-like surface antigen